MLRNVVSFAGSERSDVCSAFENHRYGDGVGVFASRGEETYRMLVSRYRRGLGAWPSCVAVKGRGLVRTTGR